MGSNEQLLSNGGWGGGIEGEMELGGGRNCSFVFSSTLFDYFIFQFVFD